MVASFHADKCCHLANAYTAPAARMQQRPPVPDLEYIHKSDWPKSSSLTAAN